MGLKVGLVTGNRSHSFHMFAYYERRTLTYNKRLVKTALLSYLRYDHATSPICNPRPARLNDRKLKL